MLFSFMKHEYTRLKNHFYEITYLTTEVSEVLNKMISLISILMKSDYFLLMFVIQKRCLSFKKDA